MANMVFYVAILNGENALIPKPPPITIPSQLAISKAGTCVSLQSKENQCLKKSNLSSTLASLSNKAFTSPPAQNALPPAPSTQKALLAEMAARLEARSFIIVRFKEFRALGRLSTILRKESFSMKSMFPTVRVVEKCTLLASLLTALLDANLSILKIILNRAFLIKQNQMSFTTSPHKQSRAIKRIKIKQRVLTNPQERSEQSKRAQRLPTAKSQKSQYPQKTCPATSFIQTKENLYSAFNRGSNYGTSGNNFLRIQTETKERGKQLSQKGLKSQKYSEIQSCTQIRFDKNPSKWQSSARPYHQNQKKYESNRIIHMNFKEYESIISKEEVSPSYFENVALKNDEKIHHKDHFSSIDKPSIQKIVVHRKERLKAARKLPIITKHRKPKHEPLAVDNTNSMKTIIGCHLGALSNLEIKEKLEEKWINQQKEIIQKNNTLVFTQQSEIASEVDTKQQTIRQQNSLRFNDKKKKQEKVNKDHDKIEWNKIPNEKFKETLRRILELKPNRHQLANNQRQFSQGEQYVEKQEHLLSNQSLYKPRQLVLKHKLEWKM